MPSPPDQPRSALRELLVIAGPTVATMTSYTVMTFTDKWLVSRLGPEFVGAQGNGGLAAWVPQSVAMGILQMINTYVSQNMGAGKPERGSAYAWNGVWIAWMFAALFVPFSFALPFLFAQAGIDPHQANLAARYGQVLLFGASLNLSTRAISNFFYGLHKAGVVMVAGVTANIFNLLASAILVFGNGPMPEDLGLFGRAVSASGHWLGVKPQGMVGSAYGTVLATLVELSIPLALFLSPKLNRLYATRRAWKPSWPHIRDLFKTGWPGGLMFGNEMICWGFFMVYLVSHFGPQHASAGWIAHQYMSLSFMPAVGISVACTAIVGKYMGAKQPNIAAGRAWLSVALAMTYMGLCALVFVVFRRPLVEFFIEDSTPPAERAELIRLGGRMLIAAACFQLFDAAAMVLSGALRGAGDTVFPGVVTVISSWIIIVGGGLAMTRLFPGLQSIGPWIAAALYIATLGVILLLRFLSGTWKSIDLLKHAAVEPLQAKAATTDGVMS